MLLLMRITLIIVNPRRACARSEVVPCVCMCVCVYVCVCVRAYVRACVRVCVRVCGSVGIIIVFCHHTHLNTEYIRTPRYGKTLIIVIFAKNASFRSYSAFACLECH